VELDQLLHADMLKQGEGGICEASGYLEASGRGDEAAHYRPLLDEAVERRTRMLAEMNEIYETITLRPLDPELRERLGV
jgi:hypothetical protein